MRTSIPKLSRPVRRRLQRIAQYHREGDYRRRAKALLLLHENYSQRQVSQLLCASRTSIRKWLRRYLEFGEAGLVPEQKGRQSVVITNALCSRLLVLIQELPDEYGWLASRWTTELLSRQINEEFESQYMHQPFGVYCPNWV